MTDDIDPETLRQKDSSKLIPPLYGALLKNEADCAIVRTPRLPRAA